MRKNVVAYASLSLKKLFHAVCWVGLLIFFGCTNPEEKANKLFVEASQLISAAQEVEGSNYSEAYKLYKDALTKIEMITKEYPSTQVAVKVSQGDEKIGRYTTTELKETILPDIKMKADAGEDPFTCSILVSKTIRDFSGRAFALTEIALMYSKAGQKDKASAMLSQALNAAKFIDGSDNKYYAISYIAPDYIDIGEDERAVEVAMSIDDSYYKVVALAGIAYNYREVEQKDKAVKMFAQALNVANLIEKPWFRRADALKEIAAKYAEAGEFDKALNVAKTIEVPDRLAEALAYISSKGWGKKEVDSSIILRDALKAAKTADMDHLKAGALQEIAFAYAEGEQYDQAFKIVNSKK